MLTRTWSPSTETAGEGTAEWAREMVGVARGMVGMARGKVGVIRGKVGGAREAVIGTMRPPGRGALGEGIPLIPRSEVD